MGRTVMLVAAATAFTAAALGAEVVKCQASRDVWLSAANKKESDFNMGAAKTIKMKVWQEFGIVDFDVSKLRGKVISKAYVYVKPAGGGKVNLNAGSDLKWLTVSTVSHDWVEGKSTRYAKDTLAFGATFNESSHTKRNWGWKGSRAWDVILGNGNTLRCDKPMSPSGGWLRAEIDPHLVRALVAKASYGLALMDGSTTVAVNNRINARESGKGPYLEVTLDGADEDAPRAPSGLRVEAAPNWATATHGAVRLELTVPPGAFAYRVKADGEELARWQLPFAGEEGVKQSFPLIDLPAGKDVTFEVEAVDAAGNVSEAARAQGRTSPALTVPELPAFGFKPAGGEAKALGEARVWAFPEITKVDPVSAKVMHEAGTGEFRRRNPVWDGATGTVRLAAAKGEIVSFQLAVEGKASGCSVKVSSLTGAGNITDRGVKLWRNWYVGKHSEYALPLTDTFDCPMADNNVAGQTLQAVTVDYHIPVSTAPGDYTGTVKVSSGGDSAEFKLNVKVYDVTIPEYVHFNPELNCYGGPGSAGSAKFKDSFRLAHYHRCTINRVPYSQSGRVHADWVPEVDAEGHVTDWSNFDNNLGGLLDGSWFRNNPRAGIPVPTFYLPIFEGWPKKFRDHYDPGDGVPTGSLKDSMKKLRHDILAKPVDEAFDQAYRDAWVNCTSDFVKHFKEKGWNKTIAECYLNNKPNYGFTYWTLDEPFEYLDWAALNFHGKLFKQGSDDPEIFTVAWQKKCYEEGLAKLDRDRPTFMFRGDISRPMWQGSVSDGLMPIMYGNSGQFAMFRMMRAHKYRIPTILYCYGSCNDVGRSNWESAAWCLKTFCHEGDGVLPWQSLGGAGSMTKANKNGLIIDGGKYGHAIASFRIHAFRRGAQDCELMRLLQLRKGWSRKHIQLLVAPRVPLTTEFSQKFADEAAAVKFKALGSQGFVEMKEALLKLLTE